ncbi:MAG: metalloregulator ArsR/SmtB family transcription factor [Actinomycetota bacterium]|nr:metalloregulator ArsR/SmtB family transcription factor [Actinomycetota bacterium]
MPDALIEEAARRFALLSDPTRLRILSALLERETMTVTELAEALGITAPNVSQHLARLLSARIVARQRDGRKLHYSVEDQSLQALCELVCSSLREQAERLQPDWSRKAAG